MNTNRFEARKPQQAPRPRRQIIISGSAWLGLAISATFLFVWAIRVLSHGA